MVPASIRRRFVIIFWGFVFLRGLRVLRAAKHGCHGNGEGRARMAATETGG